MYTNIPHIDPSFTEERVSILKAVNDVFTGRDKELQQLMELFDQARAGNGSFVIISGEAGTGKSRLVEKFVDLTRQQTAIIAEEDFDNNSYYQPYQPFRKLVKRLEELTNHRIEPDVPEKCVQPDVIEPSSLATLHSLPSNNNLAQQRLVSQLLQAAEDHVVILVLKNIHQASSTTWRFIHYLSESLIESKILMVLTLRLDGRVKDSQKIPVYAEILKRMNREQLIHRIELKRFTTRQIRKLFYQVFKRTDFSNSFIPIVKELSGGVPAALLDCLNAFIRHGIIYQENGIWINREDVPEEDLTQLLRQSDSFYNADVLEKKFSEEQRNLLLYAALFDRKVDYRILAALLHKPRISLVKELETLRDYKLFHELDDGYYKFRQRSVQLKLREYLDSNQLQEMHWQIAEAIEEASHLTTSEKIYLLAYHYPQTEQYPLAFQYLSRAGDLALRNFAFSEAKQFFSTAYSLLPRLDPIQQEKKKLPIVLKLAWLTKVLGDRKKSLELYQQALQLSKQTGERRFLGEILVHKGLTHVQLSEYQDAIESFRKVLNDETIQTDHKLKALAHTGMGNVYIEQSEFEKALSHYQIALELATEADDKISQANILNNMGVVKGILGNRIGAIALYSQAIPIYKENGDNYGLARVYNNIGIAYADDHNWKQANEFYGKSLGVSDSMGLVPLKSITFLNRAIALIHLDRLQEAEEYTLKARRLLDLLHDEVGMAEYYRIQGMLDRVKGDYRSAREYLSTALEKFNELRNSLGIAEAQYEFGLLSIALNDDSRGAEWLERARDNFDKMGLSEKVREINIHLEKLKQHKLPEERTEQPPYQITRREV